MSGESSLAFDIFAIDRASEVFKKVGDNAGDMGNKFGKVGETIAKGLALATAGIVGVAGVVAKAGLDEIKQTQAAAAQLTAGVKSTGGAAGVTVAQMRELADSIQNYSGQNKNAVSQSEALLLTFTNIKNSAGANNDIFNQATKATADMAARMGTDASASAIQLGKALNDPVQGITALTRVGVSFSDAQKKQIAAMEASGNIVGAQKIILAELNKEFGGSAKAAGETLPGQLARAKEAFSDVSGEIVAGLAPVVAKLATFFTDKLLPAFKEFAEREGPQIREVFDRIGRILHDQVLPALESAGRFIAAHATLFKALAVGILGAVTAFVAITGVMKAFTAVQVALNAVMDANPIALIVLALAGLAAGLVYAYKNSQTFRDIVQGVFKDVSAAFSTVIDVAKAVFGFLEDHWKVIVAVVFGPMGLAIDAIVTHWQGFRDGVKAVWDFLNSYVFQPLITVIRDSLGVEVSILQTVFETTFNAIQSIISTAWDVIKPIIDTMSRALKDVAGPLEKVAGVAGKAVSGVGGVAKSVGHIFGFASGTDFAPGGLSWVGEHGPELMNVPFGSQVIPNGKLPTAGAGGAGGGDIHITLDLDGQVLHRVLIPYAQRYKNRNGATGLA